MVSRLKRQYTSPRVRVVSMSALAMALQISIGFLVEDPETGEPIGDDE